MGTEYVCKRCGFFAKIRKNYEIHLRKKNICKPKFSNIERSLLVQELELYIQSAAKGGIKLSKCPQMPTVCPQMPTVSPQPTKATKLPTMW
jgi:hypothetical protein